MFKALIIYQSKKGKTERFANAIGKFLESCSTDVAIVSVHEYKNHDLKDFSVLFLGCWTRGRFLINQKPRPEWISVVESIDVSKIHKIVLFTTYNITVGSMFKNMARYLTGKSLNDVLCLKSRKGNLSLLDKTYISEYCSYT